MSPPVLKVISKALTTLQLHMDNLAIVFPCSLGLALLLVYSVFKCLLSATFNMHLFHFLCIVCIMQYCWFSVRKGAILSPPADKWKTGCKEIRRECMMSWCHTRGSVCKIRLGCHSNMTENKAVFFNFFIYLLTILLNWVVSLVSVVSFWWFCFALFGGFKLAISFCCFKF